MIFAVWRSEGRSSMDYRDEMEAFKSEREAKHCLHLRMGGWTDTSHPVQFEDDGMAVIESYIHVRDTQSGRDSSMELYYGLKDGDKWLIDDQPYARLYFGPRLGIRKESY